ncbi:MAG: tocopherol cyclase family protein [Acholeplasmataceae bacterium]
MIYKINHPEIFQGHLNKKNYFEGWYFKYLSRDNKVSFACIPGISLNDQDAHAFIQIYLAKDAKLETFYIRYDVSEFSYHPKDMVIQIGQSTFLKDEIILNIQDKTLSLQGHLKHQDLHPIDKSFLVPNIMGPLAYLPFMETKHGIISMRHHVDGSLLYGTEAISFKDTLGYLEKDWGTSFPSHYTWLQCAHFKDSKTSFFFSYATIPYLGIKFKGFICVLHVHQKEYRFATYNFSKVTSISHTSNQVSIILKKRRYTLHIHASTKHFVDLPSPKDGQMNQHIKEGLSGDISLKLYDKKTLIYEDEGSHAGIEIML